MNTTVPQMPEPRDEDIPITPQPALAWYHTHLAELRQRYGKGNSVAIDPARGVVASGTLAEIRVQLGALGEPREDSDVVVFVVR